MPDGLLGQLASELESAPVFSPGQLAARDIIEGPSRHACLVGGTRSGKTFLIVRHVISVALRAAESRHAILRFHANAARASVALDTLPTVMRKCYPNTQLVEHRQDGFFELPNNGSQIWIGGLDDKERVEKILGQEYLTLFLNESSQIPYASVLIALTRLAQSISGERQRLFIDLNPVGKAHWTNRLFGEKKDPVSGRPLPDPENYDRAFLNPVDNVHNLSAEYLRSLENLPERQRKRFYEGLYVDSIDGALWTYEILEACRCEPADISEDKRSAVVVAIDPSGASSKDDERADEIGIIVGARGIDGHGYLLSDRSCRAGPAEWARVAVAAFHEFRADHIVAESNFGGEMVRATIHACDPNVPVKLVTASRGKAVRAEPIATRYTQGQVHHVNRWDRERGCYLGQFDRLEEELLGFSTNGYNGAHSPDHADAAIWALTDLLGASDGAGIIGYYRALCEQDERGGPLLIGDQRGWTMNHDDGGDKIKMKAPPGLSCIYTMTGRQIGIPEDGIVEMTPEDAKPLLGHGWSRVEPVDQNE